MQKETGLPFSAGNMFAGLEELPADDVPTIRPASPIHGSCNTAEDSPEKQPPPLSSSPVTLRQNIDAVVSRNVASPPSPSPLFHVPEQSFMPRLMEVDSSSPPSQAERLQDREVRPGAVMVEGTVLIGSGGATQASSPGSDSGAIQAELVDDVVALDVTHVGVTGEQTNKRRISCTLISLIFGLGVTISTVVLILVLGIPTLRNGDNSDSSPQPRATPTPTQQQVLRPTKTPTTAPPNQTSPSRAPMTDAPVLTDQETTWINLIQRRSPLTTFEDVASPQRLALDWMLQDPFTLSLDDDDRVIQRFALAVLYFATGGQTIWNQGGGWVESTNECQWRGSKVDVACTQNKVVDLNLWGRGLAGKIPEEIGLLTSLTRLNLYSNDISGTIPSEMGLLSNLAHAQLSINNLEGSIPSELGLLTSLTLLTFSTNEIQGTIPTELGLIKPLQELSLDSNRLQGPIPTETGQLTSLRELALWANDLTGAIPTELGRLSDLTAVGVSGNDFTGTLPSEIGLATNLSFRLSFHTNPKLQGKVPSEWTNLVNIKGLYLYATGLSGSIPSNLCSTLTTAEIDCGEIECDCCTSFAGPSC